MTNLEGAEALATLAASSVFEATPLPDLLPELHVSFESMTGEPCESAALQSLRTTRCAVIGPSGSGKTSFIWHLFAAQREYGGVIDGLTLTPIRVPVGVEDPQVLQSQHAFGKHVIDTITAGLHSSTARRSRQTARTTTVRRTRKFTGGVSVGLPDHIAGGKVGLEIGKVLEHAETSTAAQVLATAGEVVATMQERDHYPVLVIDDSDQWLSGAEAGTAQVFFNRIVPNLAREWASGLVVAVHDTYVDRGEFDPAAGFVDPQRLPELPDAASILRILQKRSDYLLDAATIDVSHVVTAGAAEVLWDRYVEKSSIRATLQLAHVAATIATTDEDEAVTEAHVRGAIART